MRCDITREEIEICREKIMAGSLGQWLGFSLALGLGLFCLPQSEAPQPATSAYNLAPNPSFEGGSPRAQLLYQQAFPVFDWEPAWSVGEYRWEEGEAWEGERSLALLGTVKEDGTWAQGGWVTRFGFPAFPAYTYTFSGWVKTEQASGHTHLVIGWFGPQGWVSNTDNGFFLGGDREWVRLSVRGRPPEGATYGRLYFRSDGNWGGAWFDGAKLQLGEGPGEIAVPNGSFEVVGEKGIEGWETWPEEGWGEVVEGTEMAYEGERCVGLGEVVGRIGWVSERFHVSGGGAWEYEVGVRVNGKEVKEGQVRIGIKWEGEEEGLEVSEGLEVGGKGWQEVRHRTGVPEGVE
ncbi:MAG TPA: hypothetical protein EYP85_08940, partial [Armatimonadetes bacterium]|nr:hypothetical protein [Armatimonadota bacterium]